MNVSAAAYMQRYVEGYKAGYDIGFYTAIRDTIAKTRLAAVLAQAKGTESSIVIETLQSVVDGLENALKSNQPKGQ